jgi:hypothetical protein
MADVPSRLQLFTLWGVTPTAVSIAVPEVTVTKRH